MQTGDIYKDGIFKIADDYVKELSEPGNDFIAKIGKYESIRSQLVCLYRILVNANHCSRIE